MYVVVIIITIIISDCRYIYSFILLQLINSARKCLINQEHTFLSVYSFQNSGLLIPEVQKKIKKKGIWGLNTTTTDYDNFHKFSTRRWFIFRTISNDIDFPSHVLRNGDLFFPPKTRQANLLHTIKLLAQFFCNVNQDPFKEMDQKGYLLLEILATNGIL